MTLADCWMRQALSDFDTADRLFDASKPETFCQAVSKYQQAVEKSIKAAIQKLNDSGLIGVTVGRGHGVSRLAAVLTRLPNAVDQGLRQNFVRVLSGRRLSSINALDGLVPAFPATGRLAARNHEYPFQDAAGGWHSPADPGSFTLDEMTIWKADARKIVIEFDRLLSSLNHAFP